MQLAWRRSQRQNRSNERVAPVSTVLSANRAAFRLRREEIAPLLDALRVATAG